MSTSLWWLASYPKSGNTWLRALLTSCLTDREDVLSAPLEGENAADRTTFEDWTGIDAEDVGPEELEELRLRAWRSRARLESAPMLVKTHEQYGRMPDGSPRLPPEVPGGVVYVVRNPLDVVASYADHMNLTLEQSVADLCDSTNAVCQSWGNQFHQHLGSWSEHVRSWLDQDDLPLLVVRYEDMLADPVGELRKVLHFLGLGHLDDRVEAAVVQCSFERLSAHEERWGFPEKSLAAARFFRKGRSESWREELSPEMVDTMLESQGEAMAALGYGV